MTEAEQRQLRGRIVMRKDRTAQLMISCPSCKKSRNEYNWSVKTAARFSIGEETCPTLMQVLLASIRGEEALYDGYRLICPKCKYGINYEDLSKPDPEKILQYAEAVGQAYCDYWY